MCESRPTLRGLLLAVSLVLLPALGVPAAATPRPEREITFTVVYDNTVVDGDLQGDWGFACLVTGKERSVLFDTGTKPDILWANLEKLDLRPEEVDVVVLSHEHGDHTGGLWSFLERYSDVTVVAPDSFSADFFERVKAAGARERRVEEPTALGDGLWVTGSVGGDIVEQSLVVETPRGLVIVTGCSHPGVVEITRKVREALAQPIHLVFGGFHLLRTSSEGVHGVIQDLKQLGVERVGPTHCTGEEAIRLIREGFGSESVKVGAGRVLRFE
jgi:7,8-dihydropterin-6-yl-methyl-4-(beta-D-ribofuranosyl)aminobenzene 5'-phosphate synthase